MRQWFGSIGRSTHKSAKCDPSSRRWKAASSAGSPNCAMSDSEPDFDAKIAVQVARKLKAQRAGTQSAWFGLGMFGIIGWSVAVPTLLGALLGAWWDKHHAGPPSWTLALLAAGLTIGCANAWYWVAQQNAAINRPPPPDSDE